MLVSYVGNFDAWWSTENHVAAALENIGHQVQRIPEQRTEWATLPDQVEGDLFLWTRTAGFDPPDRERQAAALDAIHIRKVGYHLDRWHGLNRETEERGPLGVDPSPWFTHLDLLCTANGDPQAVWPTRHVWFPPAVLSTECTPGVHTNKYVADVAFVGNLTQYGHAEWAPYRRELWAHLRTWYRGRFQVFPGVGRPQIRGRDLANLYATVKVLVGDSCLAGNVTRYWSDRIPETTGRGGFIIHPEVEGLKAQYPDLVTYPLGDFDRLHELIDLYLADKPLREFNTEANRNHTLINHTYEQRMTRLLDLL